MAQVKIFGMRGPLAAARPALDDVVHDCLVEVLALPADKRFQRFFPLDPDDFPVPPGRSERYTIVEISMFEGRSDATKKQLIRSLFERVEAEAGIAPNDLEITIFETPRHNWGIRGRPADELDLPYRVDT